MNMHFSFKVVVAGAFAVGKSTLIRAISDREVVGTEAPTSGAEAQVKDTTTVGMEYGTLKAESDGFTVELDVYGVPGQDRFSFMWDIVGVGMDGLLLLVNANEPETWEESRSLVEHFTAKHDVPVLIGINRADDLPDAVDVVRSAIPIAGANYSLCNPTNRDESREMLTELLFLVLESLPEEDEEPDSESADGETDSIPEHAVSS